MSLRTAFVFLLFMASVTGVPAQQTGSSTQELQLNLEQFPDTQASTPKEELKLNLEQFEKTNDADSNENLQLNLEQFDKNNQSGSNINTGDSKSTGKATRIDKSTSPQYNYRHIFMVGGLVLLVFLYVFSRRKKSKR